MTAVVESTTSTGTVAGIISQLRPVLEEHRDDSEARRDPAPPIIDALKRSGVLSVMVPRPLGGLELDPLSTIELVEQVSRIDASAGWTIGNSGHIPYLFMGFPDEGVRELLAKPDNVFANTGTPMGMAERVEGGYRITGRWQFGSTCRHADWLSTMSVVTSSGAPVLDDVGNPIAIIAVLAPTDVEILDNWHTQGMRGTGSTDFAADGAFVPERRTWAIGPFTPGPAFQAPLFRMGLLYIAATASAVPLGIAAAAVDAAIALRAKVPGGGLTRAVGDNPVAQYRAAEALATVDAARAYLRETLAGQWEKAQAGELPEEPYKVQVQLAASFAGQAALQAIDLAQAVAGSTGIREESPLERHVRDARTVTKHVFLTPDRFENCGQILFGRDCSWPFLLL